MKLIELVFLGHMDPNDHHPLVIGDRRRVGNHIGRMRDEARALDPDSHLGQVIQNMVIGDNVESYAVRFNMCLLIDPHLIYTTDQAALIARPLILNTVLSSIRNEVIKHV